ncbi:MAG: nicotinamide-nucleotide amidase [Phycisphaerales bacterium]|jgi:nicotinamide-nucleotide amidase|nr:nicotinamide-nucleotide amidase [Phycisphaerales bacterium]
MKSIILSVGDELALGQTVDTNSAWISQQLAAVGCDVAAHLIVPDDQRAIEQAIEESVGRCDFLIISGGIGPTEDDLTRQALAAVMKAPLEPNDQWLHRLEAFFRKVGRPMPESNKIQAMIPRGATMIDNTNGTAAGIDATFVGGDQKTICRVFVMPGVPKEMKAMFARDVLPHIARSTGGAVILSRTLHTFGMGESWIAEKLGAMMMRQRNPSVGTTVSHGIVSVRINARYSSLDEAQRELDATTAACESALGDLIFGRDNESLAEVVAASLAPSRKTVSTAESCTGGLLAKMLTDIPGSSAYFQQGWVTYSNSAKRDRLGVSENLLNVHGAVSEPVVDAMARAARRLAKSDFSLAISGIAGPTGGTAAKPVGTVCIALASQKDPEARADARFADSAVVARTFTFPGDREMIRDRAAKMALAMLRFHLRGKAMPF